MKNLLLLLFLVCVYAVNAQKNFIHKYDSLFLNENGILHSIQLNGIKYLFAGNSYQSGTVDQNRTIWMMAINENDSVLILKSFSFSVSVEYGRMFVNDISDGFIVSAYTSSSTASLYRIALIKIDFEGNLKWTKYLRINGAPLEKFATQHYNMIKLPNDELLLHFKIHDEPLATHTVPIANVIARINKNGTVLSCTKLEHSGTWGCSDVTPSGHLLMKHANELRFISPNGTTLWKRTDPLIADVYDITAYDDSHFLMWVRESGSFYCFVINQNAEIIGYSKRIYGNYSTIKKIDHQIFVLAAINNNSALLEFDELGTIKKNMQYTSFPFSKSMNITKRCGGYDLFSIKNNGLYHATVKGDFSSECGSNTGLTTQDVSFTFEPVMQNHQSSNMISDSLNFFYVEMDLPIIKEIICDTILCPEINLGTDTTICFPNNSIVLKVDDEEVWCTQNPLIKWSTNEQQPSITVSQSGIYSVEIAFLNCLKYDTIQIIIDSTQIYINGNTAICERSNDEIRLFTTEGMVSYEWLPSGETDADAIINKPGWNAVKVETVAGCVLKDSVYVRSNCTPEIFIPNVFSPNGDGYNDVLNVQGDLLEFYEIKIFNRIGEKVFESHNINESWNGNFKNSKSQEGVYVYEIIYSANGKTKKANGSVTLVR